MCEPSTSASVMMMTRWYRSLARSKSSTPIPQPSAAIIVLISSLPSILSKRAFSTLRILPLIGRIAWNFRSRPCLAEPPADSPATHQVARLPRRFSRPRRVHRLVDDPLGDAGVLLEERAQLVVDDPLDDPL